MRTAISLPSQLMKKADQLAKWNRSSRSRVFAIALQNYWQQEENKRLIAAINAAYAGQLTKEDKQFLEASAEAMFDLVKDDKW